MKSKLSQPWVPIEKIEQFIQLEPALLMVGLLLGAWAFYKIFLRQVSEERHRNLQALFRNIAYHIGLGVTLFLIFFALQMLPYQTTAIERFMTYIGLATILAGAVVFVKVWRILLFEYLFLSHRRVAFPVLLVNLFTLLLTILLVGWIGAEIFNLRLAPLLATSAIFSIVLGLALQDTLGNLFAGVALQFDKPYEIGDWIEIQSTGQKWVGQVYEISWRATVLIGFTEESITVPNRVMGQAQIANFSTKYRPIIRSQVFRLPLHAEVAQIRESLLDAAKGIAEIRKSPSPLVLISETTESWIGFKLVYYIDNYGSQYVIADQVSSRALNHFKRLGIELAGNRIILNHAHDQKV